jgi:hypothetical protein
MVVPSIVYESARCSDASCRSRRGHQFVEAESRQLILGCGDVGAFHRNLPQVTNLWGRHLHNRALIVGIPPPQIGDPDVIYTRHRNISLIHTRWKVPPSTTEHWLSGFRHYKLATPTWSTRGIGTSRWFTQNGRYHQQAAPIQVPPYTSQLHAFKPAATVTPATASSDYQQPSLHAQGAVTTFLYTSSP